MAPAKKEADLKTYSGRCAARLRELRSESGLSAKQVAEHLTKKKMSVSYRSILRWETAESDPPISVFPVLAKLYGVKKPNEILSSK
uniref:helix-turn-helix domain-containing protein n=1 Tax=Gimesia alba TaxID=2527973 RepID=UPI0011A51BC1